MFTLKKTLKRVNNTSGAELEDAASPLQGLTHFVHKPRTVAAQLLLIES